MEKIKILENLNDCLKKLHSIPKKYNILTSYKKANWMVKDAVERNIQKSTEIIMDMVRCLFLIENTKFQRTIMRSLKFL